MSGVLVILVFAAFAFLMYRRILPALLAVPLMAVTMAAVAGVPLHGVAPLPGQPLTHPGLGDIVVVGSYKLAAVFVAVIFGAMLGRITIDTGIASSIVN
ncbi:MAG: C4-dicarboxylate ABC transporter, partial [Candidatus Eremiobacteraeota bacterium]|nr:C4-dicarboxylate ABC transporter [Candidatus Eremiobacteraeota bacterium]